MARQLGLHQQNLHRRKFGKNDWQYSSSMLNDEIDERGDLGVSSLMLDDEICGIDGSELFQGSGADAKNLFEEFQCGQIRTPQIFIDLDRSAHKTELVLNRLADAIARINTEGHVDKADGSALSFFGGIIGIGGTVAAPFTLGASLALIGVGVLMSVGGTAITSMAETQMKTDINRTIKQSRVLINTFKKQFSKWLAVAQLLGEIIEDLQGMFSDLSCAFGHFVRTFENIEYKDCTSHEVDCILICAGMFYGVAKNSTHVVRNVERLTRIAVKLRTVKSICQTTRQAGGVIYAAKGAAFSMAIGKPQLTFSATNQVLASGREVISTVQKSMTVGRSAKFASVVADGSGKVVKTERAVHAIGQTITKDTLTVTKTVSRLGVALGVIFAVVDLYEFDKAQTASKTTCDAEKELRSCIPDIQASTNEVMSQVEVYKQVIRIKEFFEHMLRTVNGPMEFDGVNLPLERAKSFVDRIERLRNLMS